MMGFPLKFIFLVIVSSFKFLGIHGSQTCYSPQYLELGTMGTIDCTFDSEFFGILWYNTTDYINNDPILHYRNSLKTGPGYDSGEFDVHPNGSLIIRNVSLQHDNVYTVAYVHTKQEEPVILEIRVMVIVNAQPTTPVKIPTKSNKMLWSIAVILVPIAILIMLISQRRRKYLKSSGRQNKYNENNKEEVKAMLTDIDRSVKSLSELKAIFLEEIKVRYKDMYESTQPLSYIRDKACRKKVFVDGNIDVLCMSTTGSKQDIWESLVSYKNIFKDQRVTFTRYFVEGESGYGKSTVSVQMAHDWCNESSYLNDVEILILLPLKLLAGALSIYQAIKLVILPIDSCISEINIKNIIEGCNKVIFLLDGFDEYPGSTDVSGNDILDIIGNKMFQRFTVITTTRSSFLPKKYAPSTKRLRLNVFNDSARGFYIKNAVVGKNNEWVQKIKEGIQNNQILSDLCQIPLMFVIFAHITYEDETFRGFSSITRLFRTMMSCLHSHTRQEMTLSDADKYQSFETDHHVLDRLAFEALQRNNQKICWERKVLTDEIGQEFYEFYTQIGILVEDEIIDISDNSDPPIPGQKRYKTDVRFIHKIFCEWYAAHYLSQLMEEKLSCDIQEFLQHLSPYDLQYFYRFACGLKTEFGKKIITYLKNIEGGIKFANVCILERSGQFDEIKEAINELCSEGVIISGYDSLLLQRASIQLLEIAAKNGILVKLVVLESCVASSTSKADSLILESGLTFPVWIPVKKLQFSFPLRDISSEKYQRILIYSSRKDNLKELWFTDFVPPKQLALPDALAKFNLNGVQVFWQLFRDCPKYKLNLKTGLWEDSVTVMEISDSDYEDKVSRSRQRKAIISHQERKEKVKEYRKDLRVSKD